MKDVVFLDRDGVINYDSPEYIKSWSEFAFIPKSLSAIRELTEHGFSIIVITNQSAIKRGIITEQRLSEMHARMRERILETGGSLTDIFFCPHTDEDDCGCRKPKPGLLLQARQKYGLALDRAYMVGDSARDIECGLTAGVARTILVETGNGPQARALLAARQLAPHHVAPDLYRAARWIMQTHFETDNSAPGAF